VLASVVDAADLVVLAWGVHAPRERLAQLTDVLEGRRLYALGVTKDGAPRHPLYARADVRPSRYCFGLSIAFAASSFFLSFFSFAGGALV